MASPTFTVQIILGASLRDVTSDVRAININVGRQRVLDTFTAGTCRIALNNDDAKYTPLGGGTYSDAQWINAEVRVAVNFNSASNSTPLFRGLCDDVDVHFPDKTQSTLIVKASDGLSKLARTELVDNINGVTGNATFAEQVGSARFTAVLDNAQVAYPNESSPLDRAVDTSSITMAAETVASLQTSTYLARLAQSEDGAIYCRHGIPAAAAATAANRGNVLTYKKRYASSSATGLTFGGSPATTDTPPFTSCGHPVRCRIALHAGHLRRVDRQRQNLPGERRRVARLRDTNHCAPQPVEPERRRRSRSLHELRRAPFDTGAQNLVNGMQATRHDRSTSRKGRQNGRVGRLLGAVPTSRRKHRPVGSRPL
jgi:hypothetical protein